MPELPDLENVRGVLNRNILNVPIAAAEVKIPIVIRFPSKDDFETAMKGNAFTNVSRRGKYMLMHMKSGHIFAVNLMLTGHLQLCDKSEKDKYRTCWALTLADGRQLRNYDQNLFGREYLVPDGNLSLIPNFTKMGPEALEISKADLVARLKKKIGQIKNILVDEEVIAGIGNAYVDEILFEAGIYPFRKRTELSQEELEKIHDAIQLVIKRATEHIAKEMGDNIHLKIRDFLMVHLKGGQPCPKCGTTISQITPNGRITSYCLHCQPTARLPIS